MIRQRERQLDKARSTFGCLAGLLLAVLILLPCDVSAQQQQAWEFSPYKVEIWLATETSAELDAHVQRSLSFALSQRIDALIGAPWDATIVEPPAGLRSSMLIDSALITPELLTEVTPESLENDKIILLTVHVSPREFVVQATELDCRTQLFGAPVRRVIRQPQLLDIACFEAVADSFRAVTRLEEGAPTSAIVRIRAGGLVLSKSSPCYIGPDDVLLPIQRNNDRDGTPKRIVLIEWTFLQVQTPDETNPYLMTCRVWSGKPNPVTGKLTARKERYALKVKPTTTSTSLHVLSRAIRRSDVPYPIPGLEVYAKAPVPDDPPAEPKPAPPAEAAAEAPAAEEGSEAAASEPKVEPPAAAKTEGPKVQGDPAELLGRTDWNGSIDIGQSDTLLRIIYLKNGAQLLARLPMVPGLDPVLYANVPDDAPRLQAEGFVKGLQGQLIDLESQRQILKARFMLRIEEAAKLTGEEREAKLKEAQDLLEEIKQLPTRNDLVRQLDVQQNQQLESPIKSVQALIDQLYAKMREALGKYLSPRMIDELTAILNDARRG